MRIVDGWAVVKTQTVVNSFNVIFGDLHCIYLNGSCNTELSTNCEMNIISEKKRFLMSIQIY
jgi:hypothetical protein